MIKNVLLDKNNLISVKEFTTIIKDLKFDNHHITLDGNKIHFKRKNKKLYISKYKKNWELFVTEEDTVFPLYRLLLKIGRAYTKVSEKVNKYVEEKL